MTNDQLTELKGDLASLEARHQRFHQIPLEQFAALIATAEAEASLRNAVFNLVGHLPGLSDEELLALHKSEIAKLRNVLPSVSAAEQT